MVGVSNQDGGVSEQQQTRFRKSLQALMPYQMAGKTKKTNGYDIYPSHSLGDGRIYNGYASLAKWMADYPCIIIDGFSGVLWDDVQICLEEAFAGLGLKIRWVQAAQFLKPAGEIRQSIAPGFFSNKRNSRMERGRRI